MLRQARYLMLIVKWRNQYDIVKYRWNFGEKSESDDWKLSIRIIKTEAWKKFHKEWNNKELEFLILTWAHVMSYIHFCQVEPNLFFLLYFNSTK